MNDLQKVIEDAFERRADITPRNVEPQVKDAVMAVIDLLDMGELRVAERTDGQNWTTHQWLKKAVLLSFRLEDNASLPTSTPRISAKAAFAWCRRQPYARVPTSARTWC